LIPINNFVDYCLKKGISNKLPQSKSSNFIWLSLIDKNWSRWVRHTLSILIKEAFWNSKVKQVLILVLHQAIDHLITVIQNVCRKRCNCKITISIIGSVCITFSLSGSSVWLWSGLNAILEVMHYKMHNTDGVRQIIQWYWVWAALTPGQKWTVLSSCAIVVLEVSHLIHEKAQ